MVTCQGIYHVPEQNRVLILVPECRTVSICWTFGQYDGVALVETPDDATLMSALLSIESGGNVRTETLKAFTYEETSKIIGNLP